MDPIQEREAEYQNILEALTKCVDGARVPYNDTLGPEERKVRLDEADRHLQLLSGAFGEIMTKLKKERNLYVPINRLVDEVLIEIWTYTGLRDRFSVSQVSSKWRRVALSATSLWTLLDLEFNHGLRLRNQLERSGSSPLHVVVGPKQPPSRRMNAPGFSVSPPSFSVYNNRTFSIYYDYSTMIMPYNFMGTNPRSISLLTQKEFDGMLTRCATLDAFVGDNKRSYVTPKTLTTPMPYLRTLRLMGEGKTESRSMYLPPNSTLAIESIPTPMFGKETPLLRELYFEYIHAQWEDPIYKNLTVLRLSHTTQRITIQQLLPILESCPNMTTLELKECLQYDSSQSTSDASGLDSENPVSLLQLDHFHLQECNALPMIDLLYSLSLSSLDYLYLGVTGLGGLADKYERPLKSLLPTIKQTKDLVISGNAREHILQGLNRGTTSHDTDSNHARSGRWSYVVQNPIKMSSSLPGLPLYPHLPTTASGHDIPINQFTYTNVEATTSNDTIEWIATAITLGMPPTSPEMQYPDYITQIRDNSDGLLYFLEHISLGGVQLHKIERLKFNHEHFTDAAYCNMFTRFEGIRKLKLSYSKGLGILTAIIKQELCPMLTDIYLWSDNSLSYDSSPFLSPNLLADWVESRQKNPSLQQLRKVFVQFSDRDDLILDEETRERIQKALSEEGIFIWKTVWSPGAVRGRQWTRFLEEDDDIDEQSGMEIDEVGSSGDTKKEDAGYPIESEWPLPEPGLIREWTTGPW